MRTTITMEGPYYGKELRSRNDANQYRDTPLALVSTFLPIAYLSNNICTQFGEKGLLLFRSFFITTAIGCSVSGMQRTALLERTDDPDDRERAQHRKDRS